MTYCGDMGVKRTYLRNHEDFSGTVAFLTLVDYGGYLFVC